MSGSWVVSNFVIPSFGFVHGGEREVERKRGEEEERKLERVEILFWVIYFII